MQGLLLFLLLQRLCSGYLVDLDISFSSGRGIAPSPTCRFDLDGAPGTDFSWYDLIPSLPVLGVRFWSIAGSNLTLRFYAQFGLGAWSAEVHVVRVSSLLAPACWMDYPERSRYSLCKPVLEVWRSLCGNAAVEVRQVWRNPM